MAAQHTPAPWAIGVIQPKYFQIDADGDAICVGGENAFCYAGNIKANALLIAAAPDLLTALQGLLAVAPENVDDDDDPEQRGAWARARAVVAAATDIVP